MLLLAIGSLETASSWWHLFDVNSVAGIWLFALPDLLYLHVAPGLQFAWLLDTVAYLAQSLVLVLLVQAAIHGSRTRKPKGSVATG